MNRLMYVLEETFSSLRKNLILAVAAVAVVAVSLGILGLVVLGVNVLSNTIKNSESKVGEINIYLKDQVTETERVEMQRVIESMPEVNKEKLVYKSKADALEEFKNQHPDNPELWELLEENPLPASFVVVTLDPAKVGEVANRLENDPAFQGKYERIKTASPVIEKLENVYEKFRYVGFLVVIVLGVVSILLVSVTIQVAIFARRREIAVMKLVGATNWFIRWPFVLEGISEGLVGSAVAILVALAVKVWILDKLIDNLQFLRLSLSPGLLAVLFPCMVLGGVVIGALGSAYALGRFLEV